MHIWAMDHVVLCVVAAVLVAVIVTAARYSERKRVGR
jgi:hypothetical protein